MVENIGKKFLWIGALLLGSVLSMVLPREPFRLGLDLQGGTRLEYSLDFQRALEDREITPEEYSNRAQLLQDTLDIIRERVDPAGVLEASFRPQGSDSFVIEIPRIANMAAVDARAPLKGELRRAERSLALDLDPRVTEQSENLRGFSSSGGVVGIGDERIRYGYRSENVLYDLARGYGGTQDADHPAGSLVVLISDDPIRAAIENPGALRFYIGAQLGDFSAAGTTEERELEKVRNWIAANPGSPISLYNRLPFPQGAPDRILWFPRRLEGDESPLTNPIENRLSALLQPETDDWSFDSGDLKNVNRSQDRYGYPAVGLEMTPSAAGRFGDYTKAHTKRLLGVVVNDVVATLATINEPLYGSYQISGGHRGFTEGEVKSMVKVLRSGSLKIKPQFKSEERIGASLGDEYVRRGAISAFLGLATVLIFMLVYYRKLGVLAAASMICNLVFLLGAMAFLRATLTLPGVAGILLTVGMAVDANILIYERIREESDRGRKIAQAAKHGFDRAMVTIVDANLTTFITAAILWKVGTGPVRGFATTLMIGILTSMFSALVVTRALVSLSILRGATGFRMSQIIKDSRIGFMALSRKCIPVSALLIVIGVGLFISVPDKKKFSIDFLGGFTVTVRTQDALPVDAVRARIRGISGDVGTADVIAILDSGSVQEGFRRFRISFKGSGDEEVVQGDGEGAAQKTGETLVRGALEDLLQEGPVVVTVDPDGTAVQGKLYFEEPHPETDIERVLSQAGLSETSVRAQDERVGLYSFTARAAPGSGSRLLTSEIARLFSDVRARDSQNREYALAEAVPEAAVVGAQVVGELRDKAIAAILLSLFAVVMYIRVRFAEYSYGIAAVIAIVHDVLFVLGVLAIADYTGFIDGQISLPMIAAFLTIIGYSLNDTIVIFDRIRENRPRMKGSLSNILDTSINQTLSRTVLTSLTTMIAVAILLAFNYGGGSVLEGFSFALLVGILVGTYSTIFIASPAFLWLETRAERRAGGGSGAPASSSMEVGTPS